MALFPRFRALVSFVIVDLRVKETADDRAKREYSCKPKPKAHHCSGA